MLTRRVMSTTCNHHLRSAIERLYLSRSEGGWGIVKVEGLYNCRLVMLAYHFCTSSDNLVQLCHQLDVNVPPCVSIMAKAETYCACLSINAERKSWPISRLKRELCGCKFGQLMDTLSAKPLHGRFQALLDSKGIDASRSMYWLHQHLHSESESTLCAVQDQVIAMRVYEAKIMQKGIPNILCRVCGQLEETIVHFLCACSALAPTLYLYRHNLVAKVLHWHLLKIYSLPLSSQSWYLHLLPLPVSENSVAKLLWDFGLVTESHDPSNRPDVVLFDYEKSVIQCFEVSCPADININAKESDKVQRY